VDGKSLVGNRHDYYGKIDYETPAFLQQVAADTVKQFSRHEEGRLRRFFYWLVPTNASRRGVR